MILFGITISIPFTVMAYNNHNYNNYVQKGLDFLADEKYEEAIYNFDSALKYNKGEKEEINKLVDNAVRQSISMGSFEEGIRLFYNKEYEAAITSLSKVITEDSKRYSIAQEKINECRKAYSDTNINAAKDEAMKHNYVKALSYLNTVLKADPSNQEAVLMKNDYTNKSINIASK